MELLSHIDPSIPQIIEKNMQGIHNPENLEDAKSFFMQPLLATKLHIEAGGGGAPVLDKDGKAIGFVAMSDVSHAVNGETLVAPAEYIKGLKDDSPKFEFKYSAHAAPWAENYLSDWRDDKTAALTKTAMLAGAGAIGYHAGMRLPTVASALLGAYGVTRLGADLSGLMQATDSADTTKYGLAAASDLGTIGGAVMTLVPRLKPYGLALAGASLLGHAATDFVQNRWMLDSAKRLQGEPHRPPFKMDDFLR